MGRVGNLPALPARTAGSGGASGASATPPARASRGATPIQVALNWLIRQPRVITIPKTVSEAHLRENRGAYDIALSDGDVERLDRLA